MINMLTNFLLFILLGLFSSLYSENINLQVQFTNLKESGIRLEKSITIRPTYRETRYIPFLTYETTKGSHGMSGTDLPGDKKESIYAKLEFPNQETAFIKKEIPDSIFSIGGYKLKEIEIEYEYGEGKERIIKIAFIDPSEAVNNNSIQKDISMNVFHFLPKSGYHYTEEISMNIKIFKLEIDCTDFIPIEMNGGDSYLEKHGWKYKSNENGVQTYNRNKDQLIVDAKRFFISFKQDKNNLEYPMYYRIFNKEPQSFEYLLLKKEELKKHLPALSPYITIEKWNSLKKENILSSYGSVKTEIIPSNSDMDKYGYERVVFSKLTLKKKENDLVFLITAKNASSKKIGYYTVYLEE